MAFIEGFDPFKILKAALKRGGDFADIYMEETVNTSIVCEEDRIEKVISGRDRGLGLRVIFNFKTAYAYTNDLTEKGLLTLADTVSMAVKDGRTKEDISLLKKEISQGFAIKIPPSDTDLLKKVELVKRGNSFARGFDRRIHQVKVVYGDGSRQLAVINSLGQWVEEKRTGILFLVQAVAAEGDVIQTGYEPIGGAMGLEIFEENPPERVAEAATKRAILMLRTRKALGGKMPVVLSSKSGGTMIHEAIGHGLEADLAQQGLSVYSGKIGERVASPLVTVVDDPTLPQQRGSYVFDDEGVLSRRTILVEEGVLRSYLYDRLTALKDGVGS